jgi:hypothetical protein
MSNFGPILLSSDFRLPPSARKKTCKNSSLVRFMSCDLARYLIAEAPDFLNGSCLGLDGGIAGRLHDPV